MEIVTVLWGQDCIDLLEMNKSNSPEKQRYDYYKGTLYGLTYATRKETDTHVYWSISNRQPRFENGKLFYTNNNSQGATYDKSTKKLKIWFGSNMYAFDSRLTSIYKKNI